MTYGVKDIVKRYGSSQKTVLAWIHSGELKAIDLSLKRGGKPRWRITEAALAAFEAARTMPAPPPKFKHKRTKTSNSTMEFFK